MFSYQQIARWVPFSIDPVTTEDWVANREIFGYVKDENPSEEEKALELAYLTEMVREKKSDVPTKDLPLQVLLNGQEVAGIVEVEEVLIVAPAGKAGQKGVAIEAELLVDGKQNKISVLSADLLTVKLDPKQEIKLRVRCKGDLKIDGKSEAQWNGTGKASIIFDTRGRPLPATTLEAAREFAIKVKQQL
jgi:hypothetical protein